MWWRNTAWRGRLQRKKIKRKNRYGRTNYRLVGHSDIRTTLDIYTQTTDPEAARMVNQVTNRILGLGEEVEPESIQ